GGVVGVVGVADQAVALGVLLALVEQVLGGALQVVLVLAAAERAALHEQGHAGQGGHGDGVAAVAVPVAVLVLLLGEVFQALADRRAVLVGDLVGRAGRRRQEPQPA